MCIVVLLINKYYCKDHVRGKPTYSRSLKRSELKTGMQISAVKLIRRPA